MTLPEIDTTPSCGYTHLRTDLPARHQIQLADDLIVDVTDYGHLVGIESLSGPVTREHLLRVLQVAAIPLGIR